MQTIVLFEIKRDLARDINWERLRYIHGHFILS